MSWGKSQALNTILIETGNGAVFQQWVLQHLNELSPQAGDLQIIYPYLHQHSPCLNLRGQLRLGFLICQRRTVPGHSLTIFDHQFLDELIKQAPVYIVFDALIPVPMQGIRGIRYGRFH